MNIVFVGVYFVLVLKEARESLKKINAVLTTVDSVNDFISNPQGILSNVLKGIMSGMSMAKSINSLRDLKNNHEKED